MAKAPRVYADYNATSPLRAEAREASARAADALGNPSSVHAEGRAARGLIDRAREELAQAIGARPAELVFTSCATEANNLALKGLAFGPRGLESPDAAVVTTVVEHPSVRETARWLGALGRPLHELTVDARGQLAPGALDDALMDETLVVSVIWANNETGVVLPIRELAERARRAGALVHVDATQALGRLPGDVTGLGADLVTLSSHKVGGPRGAGLLWVRRGTPLAPLLHGGHQERNRRGGTEDTRAIVGFAAAARAAAEAQPAESQRLRALTDALRDRLRAVEGVAFHDAGDDPARSLPNTVSVSVPDVEGETLLIGLDLAGVSASSGSACTAGSLEPSHVLLSMDVPRERAEGAVRLSLGFATTEDEVERIAEAYVATVAQARALA